MRERGQAEKEHNGILYTHVMMYRNKSDAIEKSKELHTDGHLTWIESGSPSEYYPYHLYWK